MAPIQVSQANTNQTPTIKQEPGTETSNSNQSNQVILFQFINISNKFYYLTKNYLIDDRVIRTQRQILGGKQFWQTFSYLMAKSGN
jgi:hypothetical protein